MGNLLVARKDGKKEEDRVIAVSQMRDFGDLACDSKIYLFFLIFNSTFFKCNLYFINLLTSKICMFMMCNMMF